MIKNLFIYWHDCFEHCPNIIKKCLQSWKIHNLDWKIYEISNNNLTNFINFDDIPNFENKKFTIISLSDLIRIKLLKKYGGLWCDATTFCTTSLSSWLNEYISYNFFVFNNQSKYNLLISSWFIYSNTNNYIIDKWYNNVINFINNSNFIGDFSNETIIESKEKWIEDKYNNNHYFWFHYLFEDLYHTDYFFKLSFDNIKYLSSYESQFLFNYGITKEMTVDIIEHIEKKKSYLYKLSHKFDLKEFDKTNNCLKYLFN